MTSAAIVSTLRRALADNRPLWIGYADTDGTVTQQIVDPIRLGGGILTAFDHRTEQVRSFSVSRVTGVAPLPADVVET
jgi:predicted DNA-binding transcriptional regulator YafY